MRKNTYMLIDTETEMYQHKQKVYNFGVIIYTKEHILLKDEVLISNNYFEPDLIGSWFSKKNKRTFDRQLQVKRIHLVTVQELQKQLKEVIKLFKVTHLIGYNLPFDDRCLNELFVSHGLSNPLQGLIKQDLWQIAQNTICQSRTYLKFVKSHGLLTPKGRPKTSAEAVYSFINGDYIPEKHTALADCEFEYQIHRVCMKQKKRVVLKSNLRNIYKKYNELFVD